MDAEMSGEASGWKPIDFVTRAQREALLAITTVLMREMKRDWGDRWLEELNSLVTQPPSPDTRSVDPRSTEPLALVNDKLDWDLARLTRSMRVLTRKLSYFSAPEMKKREGRIRSLTETVRDTRNQNAHQKASLNYNDLQSAKSHLNSLIEYVTAVAGAEASKSIKAISAEMIAWVERRVAEPEKTSVIDPADIAQIKAMLLELHREQKAAKEEKKEQSQGAQATKDSTGNSDNTTSAEQTSMKSEPAELHVKVTPLRRRRNPIPAARNGLVLFPAVVASDETKSELCIVSCDLFQPTHQMSSVFLPIGLEVAQANLCYSIIQNARQDEDNADLSIATVRARFDPNEFQGPSFGLATAIADRSARYGFSDRWTGRHVIATGEIVKGGQGEVGPIDGFEAKVRLLEREAPVGSLFIFPTANLGAASAEILEALRRAEERGAFYSKAVSHIRELEELFADPAVKAPLAAKGISESEAKDRIGSEVSIADRRPGARSYKKLLLGSVAAGIVLLAGLYGAGHLRDQFRVDPVLEQANEEHLIVFRRLSQQVASSPDDAELCRELVAIVEKPGNSIDVASGLNDGDVGKAVADCSEALTQSDRRWAALAESINASSGSILDARSALTAFDLSRLSEEGKAALMQQTEERGTALAASDARLISLAEAARAVLSERMPDLDMRLIGAVSELDAEDKRRLNAQQQGYVSLASDAAGRLSASERRLSALSSSYERLLVGNSEANRQSFRTALRTIAEYDKVRIDAGGFEGAAAALADGPRLLAMGLINDLQRAVTAYQQSPTESTLTAIVASAKALTADDRIFMTEEQGRLLDEVRSAELELLQSNLRLQALLAADRQWEHARTASAGIKEASDYLTSAADALSAFDRARFNAEHRVAFASAEQLKAELSGSASRIDQALRSAELVLLAREGATEEMHVALKNRYSALTPVDHARLNMDEKAILARACTATYSSTDGAVGTTNICSGPTITFGPRVLKPSVPLR